MEKEELVSDVESTIMISEQVWPMLISLNTL